MMNLGRLEGFYRVAQARSYAAAVRAAPYPITQPALHQQVKKLERELGVALLERVGKARMALTDEGRVLFDFVEPFFERLPRIERDLRDGTFGGTLRIDAAGLVLRRLLPGWLKDLRRRRRDVRVELRETERPELKRLREGEVDLIVDYIPEMPSDIDSRVVAKAKAFLVVPSDHPLAKRPRVGVRDLAGETFISYSPGLLTYQLQMQVLREREVAPRDQISAGSAETILGFVESGLGVSIIPEFDPQGPRGRRFRAYPVRPVKHRFPIVAAWRKGASSALLAEALACAPTP